MQISDAIINRSDSTNRKDMSPCCMKQLVGFFYKGKIDVSWGLKLLQQTSVTKSNFPKAHS